VHLSVPGRHNVLNALGVLAIAMECGIGFDQATAALARFHGVQRRFQFVKKSGARSIIDDYGHHPTEIVATLETARTVWKGRILTVFQPHRYTRTEMCWEEFLRAFGNTDILYLCDIYAAGEDPIEGVSSELLSEALRKKGVNVEHVGTLERAKEFIVKDSRDGDLVVCLGAGSITRLAGDLAKILP
jgi:UDP-N-acetylmuramate--alanine ligase